MGKGDPKSSRAHYEALAAELSALPAVTLSAKPGFGQGGLMVGDKLFALLRGDELLLKLPAPRVVELIERGDASPFDAGKGRPMKEWATISTSSGQDWKVLAREAFDFGSGAKAPLRKS